MTDPSPENTAGPAGTPAKLSHVRADGAALMVDVTDKPVTKRTAQG
jgi:cyclic pyranopterin phosphate synthase